MNSLKSLCSFAKCTPLALGQFKKEVEPLLGRELRVKLIVGVFGCLEVSEDSNAAAHGTHCTTRDDNRHLTSPALLRYGESFRLVASTSRVAVACSLLGYERSEPWDSAEGRSG